MNVLKPTLECDIYSLGIVIKEIVTGRKEMPNKDRVRVISLTTNVDLFRTPVMFGFTYFLAFWSTTSLIIFY